MDAQEDMHMNDYNKITALYSRLSVGDEDRDGGESNSIQNQKIFLENYARGQRLTNIRHYIDDDESGRFFDRSAYSRMMEDVENGKIGVCIMKDLTRWGRDYLQVGNAMEIFRRNNVRFIAVNNGIDSEKPDTLEFAPFINIMSEWYAKDISKKVKTGIKTKGMSGKPIATEAPYGYVKDPDNKDFWIIDEEAAEVVRLIFRLFIGGKNRNQIAVYLKNEQMPPHAPPSFSDRATLWNSVELYEKTGNAQLAREIDAALPIELSREEQIRLVREYCSSQFVSRGMCVDFAIHDTDSGNPHCHIMLTMRPLDERGAWAAKSKKEYDIDENGERIRLPSGRYKTHKVDLTGWNDKGNALLWRKAWADISNAYLERAGRPERIDHRSNAERGIDELPTVHMGVAACQMEKKGIATEKGELNRNIQKANRLIREIRAQIGKLKEWIGELFKARENAPEQPPQSPGLANLLMKYLSVQREKSRKYSQSWQRQHAADELKTVAKAVGYLSEHGISTLAELDATLSSVSDQADAIRAGMKTAEKRMKELQKLIEYGKNYTEYKPIHDELKKLKNGWTSKRDKYEEAHRAELTLWNAASRYLHANLPKGTKSLPIAEWEKEYATLSGQRTAEYTKLKETRAEVAELHNIRKCVDIALKADQPEQTRTKQHDLER
ncbi:MULTISPECIES: MobA/MobL family protein [Oscillospiraceae]|nr:MULTISPECIES: MobA/MobL family protein [Oscillospiraceae]OUN26312.1 hypothetical protein B5G37_00875 [Pseudoflavonifractor sp. An85]OUQ84373.1 hypothetical protein B5E42_00630 [Flavonifractor sp. An10]